MKQWTILMLLTYAALINGSPLVAAKKKKGKAENPDNLLVIGEVIELGDDFLRLKQKAGERRLSLTGSTVIAYTGFRGMGLPDKPFPKCIAKTNVNSQDVLIRITYTPPVPAFEKIPDRTRLSIEKIFEITDQNKNGKVDYVEFCTRILQSHKHMPNKFKSKLDKDKNGTLNLKELEASLSHTLWYKYSRKTPQQWLEVNDINKNGELEKEEAMKITGNPHGNFESIFSKMDKDQSGTISVKELTPYITRQITRK